MKINKSVVTINNIFVNKVTLITHNSPIFPFSSNELSLKVYITKKKLIVQCIIPFNKFNKKLVIVKIGLSLFSAYMNGSILRTISPSLGFKS